MMRETWILTVLLALIGFLGGWGVKLIVDRLTLIADKLNVLQLLFTKQDSDIIHMRHELERIDKTIEYHESRIRDLENHLPREHSLIKR